MRTLHLFDFNNCYVGSVSIAGDPGEEGLYHVAKKAFGSTFPSYIGLTTPDPYLPTVIRCEDCGKMRGTFEYNEETKIQKFTCECGAETFVKNGD